MKHRDHAKRSSDPLAVRAIIHCGQVRDIDPPRGVNALSRLYRFDPPADGFLIVTRDMPTGRWAVSDTLGTDPEGRPLISLNELAGVVAPARTWTELEDALATYFDASIYEFHAASPDGRRLRVGRGKSPDPRRPS